MTSLLHSFGVRGRLLLAFFGISGFAVLGAVAALFAFNQVGAVIDNVTRERVPVGFAALDLSRQAERIASIAPWLLTSNTKTDQKAAANEINVRLAELDRLLAELKARHSDPGGLSHIEHGIEGIRQKLTELEKVVDDRLSLAPQREESMRRLSLAAIAAQRVVGPGLLLFDSRVAQWRRAVADQSLSEEGRNVIAAHLARNVASVLPQQKAQVEIAAIHDGLMKATTAEENDLPLIAFNLARSLASLEALAGNFEPSLRPRLIEQIGEFRALSEGPDSLLDLRREEIELLGHGRRLLYANAEVSGNLTAAVNRLVSDAQADIAAAEADVLATQRRSAGVLIGVVLLSLLSSALIVWLYVSRNLIARLTALSGSMLAIAGGQLRMALPPSGRDEIGQMASALRVFRDTAVEVEEQNLRERQMVLDTIEYGVLILDPQLNVRMHNRAFRDLWGISRGALLERSPMRELLASVRGRGLHAVPDAEWESYVERRLSEIAAAAGPPQEWQRPDGRTLQYEVVALPDGGRMLTYFDLTQLKQVEAELRAAKEQAEMASRQDGRYLEWFRSLAQFLRHEVRQPVAQINSSIELIKVLGTDNSAIAGYLSNAALGAQQVWNLVERASRATDAEAYVRESTPRAVDLHELITGVVTGYQQTFSGTAFRLQGCAPMWIYADSTLIEEALGNLLSNAASYAHEDSTIDVALSAEPGNAIIRVCNKGPVISDDVDALFAPFSSTRAGPSSVHQGLGLYLVRLIVEHYGGAADICNLPDRSGVQASIRLPLAPSAT